MIRGNRNTIAIKLIIITLVAPLLFSPLISFMYSTEYTIPGQFTVQKNAVGWQRIITNTEGVIPVPKGYVAYFVFNFSHREAYVFDNEDMLYDLDGTQVSFQEATLGKDYVWIHRLP